MTDAEIKVIEIDVMGSKQYKYYAFEIRPGELVPFAEAKKENGMWSIYERYQDWKTDYHGHFETAEMMREKIKEIARVISRDAIRHFMKRPPWERD